jgi:hypothetical protein
MRIEQHIDLASHPITELDSARGNALVDWCKSRLYAQGAYVLEGFLHQEALATILEELNGVLGNAFYKPKTHNPYLAPDDETFPALHPRNRQQQTNSATLAYDFIARDSLLEEVYRWSPLRDFIARTLGYAELHPYADKLAAVNVLVYPPGTQTGWHFDNANFVVTLMLRQAQRGGVYEYAPFIRALNDENFPEVEAVLDGRSTNVHTLEQSAGDLVVFQGRYTLHRVTEVCGIEPRLIAVLSYDVEAGTMLTPHTRKTFYGRSSGEDSLSHLNQGSDRG